MQKVPNTKDFKFDQFEKYQINEILNQIYVKNTRYFYLLVVQSSNSKYKYDDDDKHEYSEGH